MSNSPKKKPIESMSNQEILNRIGELAKRRAMLKRARENSEKSLAKLLNEGTQNSGSATTTDSQISLGCNNPDDQPEKPSNPAQ